MLRLSRTAALPLAIASLVLTPVEGIAQTRPDPVPAPAQRVPGWNEMLDSLRDLPSRILSKLPEEQRSDPLVQQEAAQLALGAIASSSTAVLGADVDHPMFLSLSGPIFGVGQPNADTVYKIAHIDPTGSYRLRGRRGLVRMAIIAQHGTSPGDPVAGPAGQPGPARGQLDLGTLRVDKTGRFDLLISPSRPDGYTGDWWQLDPGTGKLMVRLVSSDWSKESDPSLSIERLDKAVERPRPNAAALRDRLDRFSVMANFMGPLLAADPTRLRAQGVINRLTEHNNDRGMMAGQFYYTGFYDLRDDEALILEAQVPKGCRYWSVILTNHLYVTTDWYNNHSSLNDAQAQPDRDGVLRIVISAKDPGVANWIDTAGYPQGLVQGRWTDCDSRPIPSLRKIALAQVKQSLPQSTPTVTPGQRDAIIRERRSAYMQRRLW